MITFPFLHNFLFFWRLMVIVASCLFICFILYVLINNLFLNSPKWANSTSICLSTLAVLSISSCWHHLLFWNLLTSWTLHGSEDVLLSYCPGTFLHLHPGDPLHHSPLLETCTVESMNFPFLVFYLILVENIFQQLPEEEFMEYNMFGFL